MPTCISQWNLQDLITEEHDNVVLLVVPLPSNVPLSHKQIIFVQINQ